MYIFFILFVLMIILDVKELLKNKKELWVYIFECIITFSIAVYYYSNTFRESFISNILNFFNI